MRTTIAKTLLPLSWRVRLDLAFALRRDRLRFRFVWRLPRRLVYWCGIRLWANATSGAYSNETPAGMPMDVILQRWEQRQGGDFR